MKVTTRWLKTFPLHWSFYSARVNFYGIVDSLCMSQTTDSNSSKPQNCDINFHICTVHIVTIKVFYLPTDAQ